MVARSDSRNDNKRGMLAEANPTTLYFTLREAFFCCLYLINEYLASILMQHLTLQLQLVSVAITLFFSISIAVLNFNLRFFSIRKRES